MMIVSEIGPENKVAWHQAYPKESDRNSPRGFAFENRSKSCRFPWRKAKRWKPSLRDHRT
jgi:hypothetical protein